MSSQRFTPEFKEEAVRQIVDPGYSVAEVSSRLGVSAHSLYKWAKGEILRLRAQSRRTEEEREQSNPTPQPPGWRQPRGI